LNGLLIAAGIVVALPGALAALDLTMLTVASLFYREPRPRDVPQLRFLVLIPAHNEEAVLKGTLAAIERARRPRDLVLVVDDRSTDRTGDIARRRGALILRRTPDMKPGRAAARADGLRYALTLDWDVITMVDADSVIEPGYFEAFEAVFAAGADAVQARSEAWLGAGVLAQVFLAAFALQGVTMPRGRDRLQLVVWLRGTGMAFRRCIAERHSFRGPGASEDGWFTADLCIAGVRARHVDTARLRSRSARSLRTASGQQTRWEAGRILMAREYVLPLLRRRNFAALETALHLVTPPLALSVFSLALGAAILALSHATVLLAVSMLLLALVALDLCISLIQSGATLKTWLVLLAAPAYVLWKVWVQARATATVARKPTYFPPTMRE
jgi:1,2-diacylglycerol 3-beta-glucosyltransferase